MNAYLDLKKRNIEKTQGIAQLTMDINIFRSGKEYKKFSSIYDMWESLIILDKLFTN